jgi:hypothetical protein
MSKIDGGRVARTAGLVIATSISTAAIQNTTWMPDTKFLITTFVIIVSAFLAAVAADYGGTE